MMNYIWGISILMSIFCALFTGRINYVSSAALSGAGEAVNLIISIIGMMALWSGIMKIAQKSGITDFLANLFLPIIKLLFPDCPPKSEASKAICLNITANLLGLGNAATPFGIKAMKELKKESKNQNSNITVATNSMIMFVVINTASLQLVPTFLCAIRQNYGCTNPMDIAPILWITSIVALTCGIMAAKLFEKVGHKQK